MTILTGVVLTIALGAVAQSGDLFDRFGAGPGLHPRDDAVTLAAADIYSIDVVANDRGAVNGDGGRVLLMTAPSCGVAYRSGDRVIYHAGPECAGRQILTYCIARGDDCPSAELALILGQGLQTASSTGTPVDRLAERPQRPSGAQVSQAPEASTFVAEPLRGGGDRPLAGFSSALGSLAPAGPDQDAEPVQD